MVINIMNIGIAIEKPNIINIIIIIIRIIDKITFTAPG